MMYYSAGILPYVKNEKGEIYFLLGKDRRQKWSDFGGKSEIIDNNNARNTASREFFEETCGSICTLYKMNNFMNNNHIVYVKGKSYTNKDYYMYLVDLKKVINNTHTIIETFKQNIRFVKKSNCDVKYIEKYNLIWMKSEDMFDVKNEDILRQVFYKTIHTNKKEILSICI